MRLVIVGGVAAGTKAASRARRVNPEAEIVIYQEEPDVSISECGLPYHLSGVIGDRDQLIARTPEKFAEKDVEALVRHRVESIDPGNKKLSVRNLETGETFEDSYDRLVISTGAAAVMPPIPGSDLEGVYNLRFLTDSDAIRGYMDEYSPKKAVVVGAGYIGLEVVENLVELGLEVSLVEAVDQLAAAYGPEVAGRIEDRLREKGVTVHTCAQVEDIGCKERTSDGSNGARETSRVQSVTFEDEEIPADLVIVGAGIKPQVQLAEAAGVEIGETGAIKVDRRMKTNLPDVWAAGDCVETTNLASGRPAYVPLGDTANQMGRVAGTNAADPDGDASLEFPGVLGTGVFKVFDLGVAKTGLSEEEATEAGFAVVTADVESRSKAGYFPGSEPVYLKLVADAESGRLLGAETVGASVDKLVDVCATAIWGRLSYPDLVNLDLAYAPPFGPVLSPVIQAATILSGKVEKSVEGVRTRE